MHYVLHAQCSESSVYTSKYQKRERNIALFSMKSANDCNLRVSGLGSTLENACTTFYMKNGVKVAFKRGIISNRREMKLNLLQNRRMIAICV